MLIDLKIDKERDSRESGRKKRQRKTLLSKNY